MKALILKGKHAGEIVKISQWCNDWFTIDSKDEELATSPFSPSSLAFTAKGMDEIKKHSNNGMLFEWFEQATLKEPYGGSYIYTFKKRKAPKEPERVVLTKRQARSLVAESDGQTHVFHNPSGILLGFDVSIERVHEQIAAAGTIEIGGDQCLGMGHGLVIIPKGATHQRDVWFVKHDPKKIKKYLS